MTVGELKEYLSKIKESTLEVNKIKDVEKIIMPCGFYHNKAKNIIACCQKLLSEFGGEVPSEYQTATQRMIVE